MPTWSGEFSLVLPDNWLSLDVTGGQRIADEVTALLERGASTDRAFTLHRGRIEKQLRAVIRSVRREPVVLAAVLVTVLDGVLPLFASLTAADVPTTDGDFRGRPGAVITAVELPRAGRAVRQQFTDAAADPVTGSVVPAAVFQWLIPMPGGRRRLVLTFVSPDTQPVLLDAFADLFAAIAESVSFTDQAAPVEAAVS